MIKMKNTCILRVVSLLLLLCEWTEVLAQNYTDARDLTLFGKAFETAHPYDRMDPVEGMSKGEMSQAQLCAGLAVAFKTNSPRIGVRVVFREQAGNGGNNGPIAARGFDLYIKKDGRWLWAWNAYPKNTAETPHEVQLLENGGSSEKDCLLYLPLSSKIESLEVITDEGSWIEAASRPFRKKIVVWGSSYTAGSGAGRCAMTWEAQLSRATGYDFMNYGFSGNSKLQAYFAEALVKADADAYVLDAFSNPSADMIRERLEPFIKIMTESRPGVPLIFIRTIYREKRNFSETYDAREHAKRQAAEEMMQEMVKKYPDVYWVNTTNATSEEHEATSDGSHPDSYGYTLWMQSVKEPVMEILSKYEKN